MYPVDFEVEIEEVFLTCNKLCQKELVICSNQILEFVRINAFLNFEVKVMRHCWFKQYVV